MRQTFARLLAVATFAGLLFAPVSTARLAADQNDGGGQQRGSDESTAPQILSQHKGLTPGQWLAVWWQEVFAIAREGDRHPLNDGGAFGGNNRTVFLAGKMLPLGSPKDTIRVTIPAGTYLVVPMITVECSVAEGPPFHGEDEPELRACANGLFDFVSEPEARIDGRPVENLAPHRVESPLFRYGPLTADNYLNLAPGTQSDAVAVGYVLVLPPFSPGVHRLRLRANVFAFGLSVNSEFLITVERPREG